MSIAASGRGGVKTQAEVVEDEIMVPGQILSVPEADGADLTFEGAVLVLVRSWRGLGRSTA